MSSFKHCARCGQEHENIQFAKLTNPIEDSDGTLWTHWSPCPTNGEPILMKMIESESMPPLTGLRPLSDKQKQWLSDWETYKRENQLYREFEANKAAEV